jgi:hypothetical protein
LHVVVEEPVTPLTDTAYMFRNKTALEIKAIHNSDNAVRRKKLETAADVTNTVVEKIVQAKVPL